MWTDTYVSDDGSPPPPVAPGPEGDSPSASDELQRLRDEILACDEELIRVLARRRQLVREVGALKTRHESQVTDPKREAAVVRRAAALARRAGVDEELVRDLIWRIMDSARKQQHPPLATGTETP